MHEGVHKRACNTLQRLFACLPQLYDGDREPRDLSPLVPSYRHPARLTLQEGAPALKSLGKPKAFIVARRCSRLPVGVVDTSSQHDITQFTTINRTPTTRR